MKLKINHLFLLLLSFSLSYPVFAQIDPGPNPGDTSSVSFKYNNKTVRLKTVRAKDGKVWLQQDLGSDHVATSTKDTGAYGDYFQWGRWDDGHQIPNSPVVSNNTLNPNNPAGLSSSTGKFYINWWNKGDAKDTWTNNPPSATNGMDPCAAIGAGWRLPTIQDWKDLMAAEQMTDDTASAFKTTLKLVPAGYRSATDGVVRSVMSEGTYWSTTNNSDISAYVLQFTSGASPFGVGNFMARANGFCLRCLKVCQVVDSVTEVICHGSTYIRPNGIEVKESGTYTDILGVTASGCDSVIVSHLIVLPEITKPEIEGNDIICAGSSETYQASVVAGASGYVWDIPSDWKGTSDSFSINVTINDSANEGRESIRVYAINECGDTSKTTILNVYVFSPKAVITIDKYKLSIVGTFAAYQWYKNGQPIPNETNASYTVTANGQYNVKVTDAVGCTAYSDTYTVNNFTGIDNTKAEAQQIKIHPNPASDVIYITAPVKVNIAITTIEGKTIRQIHHNNAPVSVKELAKGVYLLRITDQGGRLIKIEKFIKM